MPFESGWQHATSEAGLAGNDVKAVQFVDGTRLPIAFDTLTLSAGLKMVRLTLVGYLGWLITDRCAVTSKCLILRNVACCRVMLKLIR